MADYDIRTKEYVELLINEEMKSMTRDAHLYPETSPLDFTFASSDILKAEFGRIKAGEEMAPFDASHYQVKEPTDKNDIKAWKLAIENATIQYEYQKQRLLNLSLLAEHGEAAIKHDEKQLQNCLLSLSCEHARAKNALGVLQTKMALLKKQYGDWLVSEDSWRFLIENNPRLSK